MSSDATKESALVDQQGTYFETALDLATPSLYARDAFRILELNVEAGEREINRRQQVMKQAAQTQLPTPPGPDRILPRMQSADEHEVGEAAHALQDAERRLAHEFFWFWPIEIGKASSDAALRQLAQGHLDAAGRLWDEQKGDFAPAALHNLAVMHHMAALDHEAVLLDCKTQPPPSSGVRTEQLAEVHWREAMKYWKALYNDEAFWSRVTARIRALDDRSLTTGAARRLRRTLPAVLSLIDARLALRAQESGQHAHARRHVARLRANVLDEVGVEEGLHRALQALRAQIKSLCEKAKADAEADAEHADNVTERLLDQTSGLLAALDLLLSDAHSARQAEHDQVAQAALICQITFGNKTGRHSRSLYLIDRLSPVAASDGVRARIAQNRQIVATNREGGLCWFCNQEDAVEELAEAVAMYGDVKRIQVEGGIRVTWQHTKVLVPQCELCKVQRQISTNKMTAGWTSVILFGPGGFLLGKSLAQTMTDESGRIFAGALCIALITSLVTYAIWISLINFLTKSVKVRRDGSIEAPYEARRNLALRSRNDFPRIKELLSQSWSFGSQPPS